MLIDLLILVIIGCILEFLVTSMSGLVLKAAPTFTFALLITFVAVARWNLYGLLVIPFLALANWLGGSNNAIKYLAAVYDWRIFTASCCGLLTLGFNVLFFKGHKTKKVLYNNYKLVGLIFMNALSYLVVYTIMYRLLSSGNIIVRGSIPFEATTYNAEKEIYEQITVNLCIYAENSTLYNVLGLIITLVGSFILRSQGVVNNVVDKLIDDKKEAMELRNAEYFSIPEGDDEVASEELNQEDSE